MGLLCKWQAFWDQLVKILITLEPYGIFESNFAYLFISILSSHTGIQYGDKGLPSIILVGQCLLVKMRLITLESQIQFCILIHFNVIETQVCKTMIRLCQEFLVTNTSHQFANLCLDNLKIYQIPISYETYFRTATTQFGYPNNAFNLNT